MTYSVLISAVKSGLSASCLRDAMMLQRGQRQALLVADQSLIMRSSQRVQELLLPSVLCQWACSGSVGCGIFIVKGQSLT